MSGVAEEAADFQRIGDAFKGLARFRRFGDDGPVYEVLAVSATTVRIHVMDNGEELDYRIDRAINDPVAT
jgi:hypothetical protein